MSRRFDSSFSSLFFHIFKQTQIGLALDFVTTCIFLTSILTVFQSLFWSGKDCQLRIFLLIVKQVKGISLLTQLQTFHWNFQVAFKQLSAIRLWRKISSFVMQLVSVQKATVFTGWALAWKSMYRQFSFF